MVWAFLSVALVLAATRCATADVDDTYLAGEFCGRSLYWVPIDPIGLDTIGWERLGEAGGVDGRDTVARFDSLAARLAGKGQALHTLADASAMNVALLVDQGYHVFVLSQWHASLGHKVKLPKPGMPLDERRHNLVTDFGWEAVERVVLQRPAGAQEDYGVRMYFRGAGHVEYAGKDVPAKQNRQMMGTQGFSVHVPEVQYSEALNVRRTVFEICVVSESAKEPRDIVRDIEKGMDRLKLDLSYTVAKVTPVKPGGRSK